MSAMFSGVVPPLVTPLTSSGDVDRASLRSLVNHLLDARVDGVFALGSSGEAALLTNRMRDEVVETVVDEVKGRVPVFVGAIETATLRVIERAKEAEKRGASAIVATSPFYTRTDAHEIDRHFRLISDAVDVPLIAYDIPVSVPTRPGQDALLDLAADGVLSGVKDSSGDDTGIRTLVMGARERGLDDFAIFTGSELTVDTAVAYGADGVVPGLGNVDPAAYVRLFAAAKAGDTAAAKREQERLIRMFGLINAAPASRMGRGSSALGAFKAALQILGVIETRTTAAPYIDLNDAEVDFVRGFLERADLV